MKVNLGLLILLTCVACNGGGGDGDGGVDGGMGGQGGGAGGQGGGAGGQGGGAGGQGGGMGGQGGGAGGQGGGAGGQGGGAGGQGGGMGGQGGGAGGQGGGMGGQGGGCVPDCSDRMCGPDGCGGECAPGCADAESCMDGACVADGCPDGTFECGGACADLLTDANHCGSCGNACADAWPQQWTEAGLTLENTRLQPVCAQAECTFVCAEDEEVGLPQLGNNPNHCGACGNACDSAGPGLENACVEGRCIEVQIIDFEAIEDDGRARFPVQLGDGVYRLTTAGPGGVDCPGDTVLILLGDGERVDQNDDADGVPGNCSRIQGEFSADVSYEAVISGYNDRAVGAGTLVIERL